MGNYKELLVWQKSINLVTDLYKITENFPKSEIFGISSQMRRCSVSVPSNIAEGHSRRSTLDYIQFLKIARGSLAELETQIIISKNLNYISEETFILTEQKTLEISKMLNSLITAVKKNLNPNP